MGVAGLWKFLRDKYPDVFEDVDDLQRVLGGQRLGLDTALFARRVGDDLVEGFLSQAANLQALGITPVYIFDGPRSQVKAHEHGRRAEAAARVVRSQDRRAEALAELETLRHTAGTDDDHRAGMQRIATGHHVPRDVRAALASGDVIHVAGSAGAQQLQIEVNLDAAVDRIRERHAHDQTQGQARHISDAEYRSVIQALDAQGIAVVYARGEAEHLGAQLLRQGVIDALATDDGDALVFGASVVVRNLFRTDPHRQQVVRLERVLQTLQLTLPQLVDFAILCGCDFTESRGLPGVGPVYAHRCLRQHGTLEHFLQAPAGLAKLAQIRRKYPAFALDQFQYAQARAVFHDRADQVAYRSRALDPAAGPPPPYERRPSVAAPAIPRTPSLFAGMEDVEVPKLGNDAHDHEVPKLSNDAHDHEAHALQAGAMRRAATSDEPPAKRQRVAVTS